MLVISRKKDESILISDNIEIQIISIENGQVKLGISAPKDINILRKEIYINIEEENKKATTINKDIIKNFK